MAVDIGYNLESDEFAPERPIVGDVLLRIKKAELRDTKKGGRMYMLNLTVLDGDDDPETGTSPVGEEIFDFVIFPAPHMDPKARARFGRELKAFIEAVGGDPSVGAPEPEDLVDVTIAGRCKSDTNQDGEPTTRVTKYFPESWWEDRGTTV